MFQVGCIINTKLPSCVDIISTSLGFPAGALKALVLQTRASRAPAVKTSRCTADYINTLGWFCICIGAHRVPELCSHATFLEVYFTRKTNLICWLTFDTE